MKKIYDSTDIEVLISTMNQENTELLKRMKLNSDAIVINQTNYNKESLDMYNNNKIKILSFNEKGVGLSRNSALMRSKKKLNIIADDDIVFYENYVDLILKEINMRNKYDIYIFNLDGKSPRFDRKRGYRVTYKNYMRFGAAGIVIKRKKIINNRISFSLEFGGGTRIGSGEDTLFIKDSLKKGLKVYYIPIKIGKLDTQRESTWFKGYNEKYFIDKGKLFYTLSNLFCVFYALRFSFNNRDKMPFKKSIKLVLKGIKERKNEVKN